MDLEKAIEAMQWLTMDQLTDEIERRQQLTGAPYFIYYEDDEDFDSVQFNTNFLEWDQVDEMVEIFEATEALERPPQF